MSHTSNTDTIAAVATARGVGGIGVIRISGGKAADILRAMFRRGGRELADFAPRRMEHGWILDAGGQDLDEVLAVYMPGPHTFSGEDVAEIHCHGGRAVLDAALLSVLSRGARLAEAGEFTRRAYLNGRLDLSQSEAVAEMIAAPTLQGVYLARNKLAGKLGQTLEQLRQKLDWLRARLYLALDFPDDADEEDSGANAEFRGMLDDIRATLSELAASYDRARLWREGALVVLAGQVNVGKSSLLNAFLGRRRALVSDTPGTTRDFIEESINLAGLPVRLVDTAGLRDATDSIESEGIEMARELFEMADLILLVLDASTVGADVGSPLPTLLPEDAALLKNYAGSEQNGVFIVLNKSDLSQRNAWPDAIYGCPCLAVSAKTGDGLEELNRRLHAALLSRAGNLDFEQSAPPTLRQKLQLEQVLKELDELVSEYSHGIPAELLSARLDSAAGFLAGVIGVSSTEEVLDQVFSKFCIGK